MKYLKISLSSLVLFLNWQLFAQNHSSIDSLKKQLQDIFTTNKSLNYYTANKNSQGLYPLTLTEPIKFNKSSIIIKTENESNLIDLIELYNCIYEEENRGVYIYNILDKKITLEIVLPDINYSFGGKKLEREKDKKRKDIKLMYNNFINLQNLLRDDYYKNEILDFQKSISENKSTDENSVFSEEQRKLVVQASSLNNEKDYLTALIYYEKAMKLNPFSYPNAYYNMALLAAQMKRYNYAIMSMKKYLTLMPNVNDARNAQDKIYEWELNFKY